MVETHEVGADEPVDESRTLGEVLERVQGARTMPGRWLATAETADLTLEIGEMTSARLVASENSCVSSFEIDVEVRSRTSDEVIAAESAATLFLNSQPLAVRLEVPVPVPEDHLGMALWRPDHEKARAVLDMQGGLLPPPDRPTLRALLPLDESSRLVTVGLLDSENILGLWSEGYLPLLSGPPEDFVPGAELASACDGAEDFQSSTTLEYTPFAGAPAIMNGIAGTWARCLDNAPSNHAGIRIQPDGTWRHVVLEDGELVEHPGFEHEGFLDLFEDSQEPPGPSWVMFLPFGRRADSAALDWFDGYAPASDRALVFLSEVPGWPAAVYLPTTLPVRTVAPEYEAGERGGMAACEHAEQGIVPTLEESAEFLNGEFVLCSGGLTDAMTSLRFDGTEVEFANADGTLIARHDYSISDANAPRLSVSLPGRWWLVAVSRQPLKLWIVESTDAAFAPKAVFSAVSP